jgi:hypothetical protein
MTAKEKVLALVPRWSEDDAEVALRAVEDKHQAQDESILAEDKRPDAQSAEHLLEPNGGSPDPADFPPLAEDPLWKLVGMASFQAADVDDVVYPR